MYVCMKHTTVCQTLQIFCFLRQIPPDVTVWRIPRPSIVFRQLMMVQTTSLHGQLNFAALQWRHERNVNDGMPGWMRDVMRNECHCRGQCCVIASWWRNVWRRWRGTAVINRKCNCWGLTWCLDGQTNYMRVTGSSWQRWLILSRHLSYSMELEGSLSCLQCPVTGSYPEPDYSNPHPHTMFL